MKAPARRAGLTGCGILPFEIDGRDVDHDCPTVSGIVDCGGKHLWSNGSLRKSQHAFVFEAVRGQSNRKN